MNTIDLREKLQDEIRDIPNSRLQEVFDLIHFFRLGLERERTTAAADVLRFAGAWEAMDDFDGFEKELRERRHIAFQSRRQDEAGAD
jgi:hypothetical protein